ncbi:MAG: FAD-dependent oxidoreductase, partial [Acidimicrobiia bacterium]|nr:FAD-dependent oxidoreductase [Acidimicrobiia bacterium]
MRRTRPTSSTRSSRSRPSTTPTRARWSTRTRSPTPRASRPRRRRLVDRVTPDRHDVLVVGGGPAGASAAFWLAEAGHDVVVVEKKRFPREKTCGDGLTPRAVKQLTDMGLAGRLEEFHRYDGLRAVAHGITLELEWPAHPD